MKKTLITLIIAHAFTATAAFAAAETGTWYAGSKFGWSHYGDSSTDRQVDVDRDNVGGGVFTGYQINPWLAVEGGYDYLGNMGINGRHGASGSQMKSQGLQLSLKASYSLTSDWDLYGRAGLMGYRAESDVNGKIDLIPACARYWLSVPNMPLMTDGRDVWSTSGSTMWVTKIKLA